MKKILIITLLTLTVTSFASEKKVPTLKSVMQGLGKSMDDLNRGIFYEDFNLITKSAYNIANHPKPKSQLPTIVKALGNRISIFKSIDSKVHNSAMDIVDLAKTKNMDRILRKHGVVMKNCIACHQQFRSEISSILSK